MKTKYTAILLSDYATDDFGADISVQWVTVPRRRKLADSTPGRSRGASSASTASPASSGSSGQRPEADRRSPARPLRGGRDAWAVDRNGENQEEVIISGGQAWPENIERKTY